jgi:hypothetical protein
MLIKQYNWLKKKGKTYLQSIPLQLNFIYANK